MEKKKLTKAQLERRIQTAIVLVPKDKDTQTIFFSDKGLRLTTTSDYAIVETGYHRHIFDVITSGGMSRPYIYTRRFIEIALNNDCQVGDGYSYAKLMETLKAKADRSEYNIAVYYDWWCYNVFAPLYSIGESEAESFLVYEDYVHNISRNSILLAEKPEDITNKQFVDKLLEKEKEIVGGIDERVIFPKKTDEQVAQENIDAIQEQERNEAMEAQINGNQD